MKILITDDHALFREGLRHVLLELSEEVEVLEAANGRTALALADQHPDMDIVLLDLNMPDIDGLAVLKRLSEKHPTLPAVVLSASTSRNDMQRALAVGALGYIPKESTGPVMLNALRLVLAGGVYVPPILANLQTRDTQAADSLDPGNNGDKPNAHLTARQRDVLHLLAQGLPNKSIANRLGVAEATVKMHVTAIMRALDVANRTQIVIAAERLGMLREARRNL